MELHKACKLLMIKEPFYGLFLSSLNKVIDNNQPTLGVGIQGIGVVLYINQHFWDSLTDKEQIAVLKHELIHICFHHLTMRKSFKDRNLFNIAADLETNQYIEDLPEGVLKLKEFCEDYGIELPPNAGVREYYKLLKEFEEQGEDFEGPQHNDWGEFDELTDTEEKLVSNQIDHVMKDVAEYIMKSKAGLPSELRARIDSLLEIKPQVFNWKAYFRRVVGSMINTFVKKSMRKLSKRFDDSAGLKIKTKSSVLVAIDTSGSLSNDELRDFFNEIHYIYKSGVKVTIVECDASIGRVYEYKGKWDGKITGGGGTNFAPVVEYYNIHKEFTSLVFFTDGYASLVNFKAKKKIVWVISSNGDQQQKYPGITVKIPKK